MILRLLLLSCVFTSTLQLFDGRICLTGYMTDIQSWVDENGDFTSKVDPEEAIDLSMKFNAVHTLRENIDNYVSKERPIRYFSLAKCNLGRIPKIFYFQIVPGRLLSDTIEYMTLYGNSFMDTSSTGQQYQMFMNATDVTEVDGLRQFREGRNLWHSGFDNIMFKRLKELDLRACSIETIDSYVFQGMPNLKALYLGENNIHTVDIKAFGGLRNLVHIDISRNSISEDENPKPLNIEENAFSDLKNLRSIDVSFTVFHAKNLRFLSKLGPSVQRLSICWSDIHELPENSFMNTSIRYLDISGNYGILSDPKLLKGLEDSLQVLYATDLKLHSFDVFKRLWTLEVLRLTNNEIVSIKRDTAITLNKLQVLDLDKNRFVTWLHQTFEVMPSLRFLSLKDNNINVISPEMLNEIKNINYVALSVNLIVCNCHARDLIEMAAMNELNQRDELITMFDNETDRMAVVNYNTALTDYNSKIRRRSNISHICSLEDTCKESETRSSTGRVLLIDYDSVSYSCFRASEGEIVPFLNVKGCDRKYGSYAIGKGLNRGTNLLLLLIIPGILLPTMFLLFVFRRIIRYFLVSMRNSATLSLISKDEVMDDTKIYNYDVFVSYCHEDRGWLLDQLLPHLETDFSVSVCLHERDFQVGLSILENIVSCMDRSRTIMLIISKQFLRSQWCQFEMHLAQHRLLETRREDLTLILLEDIPRKLRPNTLHYLMLTKTYIVWPKEENEQAVFWRRLKKSIVSQKNKVHDNVTLA